MKGEDQDSTMQQSPREENTSTDGVGRQKMRKGKTETLPCQPQWFTDQKEQLQQSLKPELGSTEAYHETMSHYFYDEYGLK